MSSLKFYDRIELREVWYIPEEGFEPTYYNAVDEGQKYIEYFKWHRENEPAVIYDDTNYKTGHIEYWFNDVNHRYDGPAVIYDFENAEHDWYIHGTWVDENKYKKWLIDMGMDINNLTPEDKTIIDLKWRVYDDT